MGVESKCQFVCKLILNKATAELLASSSQQKQPLKTYQWWLRY